MVFIIMKKWDKREKLYNKIMWLQEYLNFGKLFYSKKRLPRMFAHFVFFMGIMHIAMAIMYYIDLALWEFNVYNIYTDEIIDCIDIIC